MGTFGDRVTRTAIRAHRGLEPVQGDMGCGYGYGII